MPNTRRTADRNVIDLTGYRNQRAASAQKAQTLPARLCCHCGAMLSDGDNEDECSSVALVAAPPMPRRKLRAE
jgi:hypothetical protein